jgi:hypothetical protein
VSDARPAPRVIDPWSLEDGADLIGSATDAARTICLRDADSEAIARAIVALTNTRGGDIAVGVAVDALGTVTGVTGVDASAFTVAVDQATLAIDPTVSHLVFRRTVAAGDGCIGVVHVRLSPSTPHLLSSDGGIYVNQDGRAGPIRSRRALDDLYARGRGERERADRLVEAMIEKIVLAHYAFYGLAIVACTHTPSAEPYRAAQTAPTWLAPPDDPFIAAFNLHEHELSISPGEIELRTPGDVNAWLRVTRSGCVAAGEVQRRPYHEELDTVDNLRLRAGRLCVTVARVLSAAADPVMLPQVFIEGVRGLKLVHDPARRLTSLNAPQDTGRYPLTIGDARDPAYVARLADEAIDRLAPLFPRQTG